MLSELISIIQGNGSVMNLVVYILAILLIIFLVLPFHEWAHAFVASKLGDTAIKYRGRLSLNPMSHIDPMGALVLLLFGFGWAKPVPVDSRNFKNPKVGMAITALAGPVANIIAGFAGCLLYYALAVFATGFVSATMVGYYIMLFLNFYISVNCGLAVFNLLPIPPLDGSKILFAFLPDKWVYKFYQYQRYIFIALIVLLYIGILDVPLNFLQSAVTNLISTVASLPFKPFM